jgi:type II secretory pathway pseudopilin PulG
MTHDMTSPMTHAMTSSATSSVTSSVTSSATNSVITACGATPPGRRAAVAPRARRAFTVIELLMSIIVIGTLAALLIVGIRAARRSAAATVDVSAVNALHGGVKQFKEQMGFLPPLAKDEAETVQSSNLADLIKTGNEPARILVYSKTVQADLDFLRDQSMPAVDAKPFGERSVVGTGPGLARLADRATQSYDRRFSEVALPYYLGGLLEEPYERQSPVPMDGVKGPGLYKAKRGGTFDVPETARATNNARQVGQTYDPFVSPGRAIKVFVDPARPRLVQYVDSNGVAFRYYRWAAEATVNATADLNMPRMVGREQRLTGLVEGEPPRERNLNDAGGTVSAQLRSARWAIVAAGPNKVFGDEQIEYIARELGRSVDGTPANELRIREEAERDNIVKVGDDED